MSRLLSDADLAQIAARGIAPEEVERQLSLYAAPPARIELVRPCRIGDGIETIAPDRQEAAIARAEEAAAAGRITVFVPASGAATRMFQSLRAAPDREGLRLMQELEAFAFYAELRELFARRGQELAEALERRHLEAVLAALLEPEGLGLAGLPKALVPFHFAADGPRTALEEQIAEAALYAADREGRVRLHFTVVADFAERCRALAARASHSGATEITLSHQSASTDTLAATPDGRPFRQADGTLLFRPGGHGALLANLASANLDLAVIKNIDNVLPEAGRGLVVRWKKLLLGRLLEVRAEIDRHLAALAASGAGAVDDARRFLAAVFGLENPPAAPAALVDRLDRPLRVCGMVRNTGEPGGGPFWVRRGDGVSRQIVESSQVDHGDPEQDAIWAAATHFNPVDIVAALRDRHGRPHDLARYVDREAVFLSDKSHGGEPLRALELPGLWNGSMADWNTLFVEVPAATFAPVKTLFDLLRPEHRA